MVVSPDAKRHAGKILRALRAAYPDATCALNFSSPFELLVATILSAQCTDVRVNQVTSTLFKKYPTARDFADAPSAELERDIQSTGFFRNKAKSLKACGRKLDEEFAGEVPQEMAELVQLPGVGRKTATVVLGTAYGIASGVVVDTHVSRVSFRLGLTAEQDAVKIEQDLMQLVPRREWVAFSHRLIHHGRQICVARRPKCEICPLARWCPRIGVEEKLPAARPPKRKTDKP